MNIRFFSNCLYADGAKGLASPIDLGMDCRPANLYSQPQQDVFEKTSLESGSIKLKKGQLLNQRGQIFARPDTEMFRRDIDWEQFSKYIKKRFGDEESINTYVYACSDGREPYTLSMILQNTFDDAQKFFPIFAKDINNEIIEENIRIQDTGSVPLDSFRESSVYSNALQAFTKPGLSMYDVRDNVKQYINIFHNEDWKETIELTKKAIEPVEFSEANILEDVENINSEHPSVVMMRNMWPYVDGKEYQGFANKLYNQLAPGSIVVIGSIFDYTGNLFCQNSSKIPVALLNAGFETMKNDNVGTTNPVIFEKN